MPNHQADLEDKILKKNIPGKYTWWDKDSDEEGAGARADWVDREASDPETEMTELEKQKKWVENDCPEPIRRTIMAREEKERARTGVKGVLADFDAWKLSADAGIVGPYTAVVISCMGMFDMRALARKCLVDHYTESCGCLFGVHGMPIWRV